MRWLALVSLLAFGCSTTPGGNNGQGGNGGSGGGVGGNAGSGGTGGGGNGGTGGGGTGGSGGGGPTVDMAMGPDMAVVLDRDPTAHPSPVDIGKTTSTGTIPTPKVYTVVWSDPNNPGDDNTMGDQLNAFYGWMLGSDYWKTWGAEYGITGGSAAGRLTIPVAPPAKITDGLGGGDFLTAVNKYIGTTGWPAASDIDSNTMFAFFIDPKSVVSNGGSQSCVAFGGYHAAMQPTGVSKAIPYLVVARCADESASGGPTEWQQDTVAASHELGEAASDPHLSFLGKPINSRTSDLIVAGGGEIGDICIEENLTIMNGTTPYFVQRLWSEKTFMDGTDNPCLPADGKWFGAAIVNNDGSSPLFNVTLHVDGSGNGSGDFTIQPFSYDPSVTTMKFEIVSSLLPTGVTLTPNIARTATTGMWGMGAPGTTFKVHVDLAGAPTGATSLLLFAVSGSGGITTERVSNWWGQLNIVSP